MSATNEINNVNYFTDNADVSILDWVAPLMPIALPMQVDSQMNQYTVTAAGNNIQVGIDIGGPDVYLDICAHSNFDYNFADNKGVLKANKTSISYPIRLFFDPPIKAVGTCISATGPMGKTYIGQMHVELSKGWDYWETDPVQLNRQRGAAPFLGAEAKNKDGIKEIWFDVKSPNRTKFIQAAISSLYILP